MLMLVKLCCAGGGSRMSLSSPDNLTTAGLYYEFNTDLNREALTLLFLGEGGSQKLVDNTYLPLY